MLTIGDGLVMAIPSLLIFEAGGVVHTDQTSYLVLEPRQAKDILGRFRHALESVSSGANPAVRCSPDIRMNVRQLLERYLPSVAVLSHNEYRQLYA